MPDLAVLKAKWFIDINNTTVFPPQNRQPKATMMSHTDGNLVTPLIDGQAYMKTWHDLMRTMTSSTCEVYHSGWRLEGVHTLGYTTPSSNAFEVLNMAQENGTKIYVMLSRHGFYAISALNVVAVGKLLADGIFTSALDMRYPAAGSNHQKFVWLKNAEGVSAMLGSIDISKTRWDRDPHAPTDAERDPAGKATHDTGVLIQGPAVVDLQHSFTDRWNDSGSRLTVPPPLMPPQTAMPVTAVTVPRMGGHSVQVLQTYGRIKDLANIWTKPIPFHKYFGYSWSDIGEFTIWAAYLNAVKRASSYIYIEDQYLLPFGYPAPFCTLGPSRARDTDIFYQLGEAIKRGVKVMVVTPSNAEDSLHIFQQYQRDMGVRYLKSVAAASNPSNFVIASISNGSAPIYVHSKLLICDDEYVLIGSANVCQRSMTHDGELDVGIIDEANVFARDMRATIWAEHLGVAASTLLNPTTAADTFVNGVNTSRGHLRPYVPLPASAPRPPLYEQTFRTVIDPYAGPPR